MRLSARLRDALTGYRLVEKELEAVGLQPVADRKVVLVRARKQLSERIGILGPIIDDDGDLAADPDRQRDLGRLFASMRYALAHHQASWPVVLIDEDPAAYLASAHEVQSKSAAFWDWCRLNLGFDREHIRA